MREPTQEDAAQALSIQTVVAAPPLAPDVHDAGALQHGEVSSCRRPTMLESRCEVTRRELTAEMREEDDHVPACFMAKSEENGFSIFEGRRWFISVSRHA